MNNKRQQLPHCYQKCTCSSFKPQVINIESSSINLRSYLLTCPTKQESSSVLTSKFRWNLFIWFVHVFIWEALKKANSTVTAILSYLSSQITQEIECWFFTFIADFSFPIILLFLSTHSLEPINKLSREIRKLFNLKVVSPIKISSALFSLSMLFSLNSPDGWWRRKSYLYGGIFVPFFIISFSHSSLMISFGLVSLSDILLSCFLHLSLFHLPDESTRNSKSETEEWEKKPFISQYSNCSIMWNEMLISRSV